jgi:hypothetical protein
MVGTHGENISTVFDHPFRVKSTDKEVADIATKVIETIWGLEVIPALYLDQSLRRKCFNKLPYAVKRKLRYLAGEKKSVFRPLMNLFYNWIRG